MANAKVNSSFDTIAGKVSRLSLTRMSDARGISVDAPQRRVAIFGRKSAWHSSADVDESLCSRYSNRRDNYEDGADGVS